MSAEIVRILGDVVEGKRYPVTTDVITAHPLTFRESQCLTLMALGFKNREIVEACDVEMSTVKTHVANIMEKLEASDRVDAVMVALHSGIISPEQVVNPYYPKDYFNRLTAREREVLDLITERKLSSAHKEAITRAMFIEGATVDSHLEHIYRKLEVGGKMQAAVYYFAHKHSGIDSYETNYILGRREKECLKLVGRGLGNREIGEALGISEHTVKTHLEHAYRKLKAGTRTQAVAHALATGELGIEDFIVHDSPAK